MLPRVSTPRRRLATAIFVLLAGFLTAIGLVVAGTEETADSRSAIVAFSTQTSGSSTALEDLQLEPAAAGATDVTLPTVSTDASASVVTTEATTITTLAAGRPPVADNYAAGTDTPAAAEAVSVNVASSQPAPAKKAPTSTSTTVAAAVSRELSANAVFDDEIELDTSLAASSSMQDLAPVANTTTTKPPIPQFRSSIERIEGELKQEVIDNGIWTPAAPVPLEELRLIKVSHWDFNDEVRTGRMIVNQAWAAQLCTVFEKLYVAHFPIRSMDPVRHIKGSGEGIAAWDHTHSFRASSVNGGWSMHAYGLAVDINPAENPWVRGSEVIPAVSVTFKDRSIAAQGMVNDYVVQVFKSIGWKWGGDWTGSEDYMHFSSNGH